MASFSHTGGKRISPVKVEGQGVKRNARAAGTFPSGPLPPKMDAVLIGPPFIQAVLQATKEYRSSSVFVMANRSCSELAKPLLAALNENDINVAPVCLDIGMGGGEQGLLKACDAAAAAKADCVITMGSGAVQDAGKIVRMWLASAEIMTNKGGDDEVASSSSSSSSSSPSQTVAKAATLAGLNAAAEQDPWPKLPPQIAVPNSFAMAEMTSVAGVTTESGEKSGFSNPNLMPTVVIFDPTIAASRQLPLWVRFGTAVRGVEHAVGAVTHPRATKDARNEALSGLMLLSRGLSEMVLAYQPKKLSKKDQNAEVREEQQQSRAVLKGEEDAGGLDDDGEDDSDVDSNVSDESGDQALAITAAVDVYVGGWQAIRALNSLGTNKRSCYPALGHLVGNQYSAR